MPHIRVEYSQSVEDLDIAALCVALRDAAVATGVFGAAGVRVRAFCADHVVIADGDPRHGFVDISIRIGAGRDAQTRARVADMLFEAAQAYTAAYMASAPFLLSLDLVQAAEGRKVSSIRGHLPPELH